MSLSWEYFFQIILLRVFRIEKWLNKLDAKLVLLHPVKYIQGRSS